ncbi:MAG: YfcE family phosphodiesterase [Planctomycetota bacterium]|jgi:putative phosphoesterase
MTSKPIQTIAILSDVHGNLPALEAVIAHATKQNVTTFWNLGDFLGYGPFANEVVKTLFSMCDKQVIGNYDLKVMKFPKKEAKWRKSKQAEKFIAFEWAWRKLSEKNLKRLAKVPIQQRVTIGNLEVLLTHGGPAAVDEPISPKTPRRRLKELASMTHADIILCGHTHEPFSTTVEEVTFLNPGSVGRPEGEDPRASYVILEMYDKTFTIRFQKVQYDIERMSRAIHAAGLPDNFIRMFQTGQNLDQVHESHPISVRVKLPENKQRLEQVRQFAFQWEYEAKHSEHVAKLSSMLFKQLSGEHNLGPKEQFMLTCAAILHDIGWTEGSKAHNKASMRMIMEDATMPLTERERNIVALAARYHRKALPKNSHDLYSDLPARDRTVVDLLSGLLRVADGLDRCHMSVIEEVEASVDGDSVEFRCRAKGPALSEMLGAEKKADLLDKVLGKKSRFISW